MSEAQNQFPPDRDAERVQEIIDHYDSRTGDEAVAEDEAAFALEGHAAMVIPDHLLPAVRALIAESSEPPPAIAERWTREVATWFPPGWDAERVQEVIDYYESQTDDEAVAEDEAAFALEGHTVMAVPHHLVFAVDGLLDESPEPAPVIAERQ